MRKVVIRGSLSPSLSLYWKTLTHTRARLHSAFELVTFFLVPLSIAQETSNIHDFNMSVRRGVQLAELDEKKVFFSNSSPPKFGDDDDG